MSDYMLVVDEKAKRFEPEEVERILADIPGVTELKMAEDSNGRTCVTAKWAADGMTTYVEFTEGDDSSLSINDYGDLGLRLAVEFNKRFVAKHGRAVRVFATQYTYDQRLDKIEDFASLKRQIDESPFQALENRESGGGESESAGQTKVKQRGIGYFDAL